MVVVVNLHILRLYGVVHCVVVYCVVVHCIVDRGYPVVVHCIMVTLLWFTVSW